MGKYILDTNLFFNMEPGIGLSDKTEELVVIVTAKIKKLKEKSQEEFFMPPKIVDEFLGFFKDPTQVFIKDFLSVITIKAPDIDKISFPSAVFYKLIKDIRERSYKGLVIAEEGVKKVALSNPIDQTKSKKDQEIAMGPVINNLRERYRQATRHGFLDSVADLDLIVLTKELNGTLVSSDEGVVAWGRIFGVAEMDPAAFGHLLKQV